MKLNQLSKEVSDYGCMELEEKTKGKKSEKSGLFDNVIHLDAVIQHSQTIEECSIAWKSHGLPLEKTRLKISLT